jgi:hypothetical protein
MVSRLWRQQLFSASRGNHAQWRRQRVVKAWENSSSSFLFEYLHLYSISMEFASWAPAAAWASQAVALRLTMWLGCEGIRALFSKPGEWTRRPIATGPQIYLQLLEVWPSIGPRTGLRAGGPAENDQLANNLKDQLIVELWLDWEKEYPVTYM